MDWRVQSNFAKGSPGVYEFNLVEWSAAAQTMVGKLNTIFATRDATMFPRLDVLMKQVQYSMAASLKPLEKAFIEADGVKMLAKVFTH